MGAIVYIRAAIAEAEHLLHEAHSPKEIVIGLASDVLDALYKGKLPSVPTPPVSSILPVAAPVPAVDPRVDQLVTTVASMTAQQSAILDALTKLTASVSPPAVPPAPAAAPVTHAFEAPDRGIAPVSEPTATPVTLAMPAFLPQAPKPTP